MKVLEITKKIKELEKVKDDCVTSIQALRSRGDNWEIDIQNDKSEVVQLLYSEYIKAKQAILKLLDKEVK